MKKTVGSANFSYPFAHYEISGTATIKYYFFGGQRVAMKNGSTLTYLHGDHLGSTVMETNNLGAVTTDERYFAYGKQRDSGKVVTDHRFTGQKEDANEQQRIWTGTDCSRDADRHRDKSVACLNPLLFFVVLFGLLLLLLLWQTSDHFLLKRGQGWGAQQLVDPFGQGVEGVNAGKVGGVLFAFFLNDGREATVHELKQGLALGKNLPMSMPASIHSCTANCAFDTLASPKKRVALECARPLVF